MSVELEAGSIGISGGDRSLVVRREPGRRRTWAVVLLASTVALAGCQLSPSVEVDSVGSYCVTGQAFVMELADDDPTQFGAGTDVRFGGCHGDRHSNIAWWTSIRVQAEKWSETHGLCGRTPQKTTSSAPNVSVSQSDYCNHGATVTDAYVYSKNAALRGSWRQRTPFTPLVTTK